MKDIRTVVREAEAHARRIALLRFRKRNVGRTPIFIYNGGDGSGPLHATAPGAKGPWARHGLAFCGAEPQPFGPTSFVMHAEPGELCFACRKHVQKTNGVWIIV